MASLFSRSSFSSFPESQSQSPLRVTCERKRKHKFPKWSLKISEQGKNSIIFLSCCYLFFPVFFLYSLLMFLYVFSYMFPSTFSKYCHFCLVELTFSRTPVFPLLSRCPVSFPVFLFIFLPRLAFSFSLPLPEADSSILLLTCLPCLSYLILSSLCSLKTGFLLLFWSQFRRGSPLHLFSLVSLSASLVSFWLYIYESFPVACLSIIFFGFPLSSISPLLSLQSTCLL